jgi:hypothetical protein
VVRVFSILRCSLKEIEVCEKRTIYKIVIVYWKRVLHLADHGVCEEQLLKWLESLD